MARSVALLGAGGIMGAAMARNLARAGFELRAWNRSAERLDPLRGEDRLSVHTDAREAAAGAEVLITMLTDADAVLGSLRGGVLEELATAGGVWVQTSTVGLDGVERCAAAAEEAGVAFVDAPVLGTRQPAEAGELTVLASGPEEQRERLADVFDAVARKVVWTGPAGSGSRLKLVVNGWLVTVVEGAAETVALAEGLDVDPERFLEFIAGGPLDLPYLQVKARAMLDRSFEPSFKLATAGKDARLVHDAAERHGLELPLLEVVHERFEQATPEHGDQDLSAIYLLNHS